MAKPGQFHAKCNYRSNKWLIDPIHHEMLNVTLYCSNENYQ